MLLPVGRRQYNRSGPPPPESAGWRCRALGFTRLATPAACRVSGLAAPGAWVYPAGGAGGSLAELGRRATTVTSGGNNTGSSPGDTSVMASR